MTTQEIMAAVKKYAEDADDIVKFFDALTRQADFAQKFAQVQKYWGDAPESVLDAIMDNEEDGVVDWEEVKAQLGEENGEEVEEEGLPAGWEVAGRYVSAGVPIGFVVALAKRFPRGPTGEAIEVLRKAVQLAQAGQAAAMESDPVGAIDAILKGLAQAAASQSQPAPPRAAPMAPPTSRPAAPSPQPVRAAAPSTAQAWQNPLAGGKAFQGVKMPKISIPAINLGSIPFRGILIAIGVLIVLGVAVFAVTHMPDIQAPKINLGSGTAVKTTLPSVKSTVAPGNEIGTAHVIGLLIAVVLFWLGWKDARQKKQKDFARFAFLFIGIQILNLAVGLTIGWPNNLTWKIVHALMVIAPFAYLTLNTRPGSGRDKGTWDGEPIGVMLGILMISMWLFNYVPGWTEFFGPIPDITSLLGNMPLWQSFIATKKPSIELISTLIFTAIGVFAIVVLHAELHEEEAKTRRSYHFDLLLGAIAFIVLLVPNKYTLLGLAALVFAYITIMQRSGLEFKGSGIMKYINTLPTSFLGAELIMLLMILILTGNIQLFELITNLNPFK